MARQEFSSGTWLVGLTRGFALVDAMKPAGNRRGENADDLPGQEVPEDDWGLDQTSEAWWRAQAKFRHV